MYIHCAICESNAVKSFSYGKLLKCVNCGFMFQTRPDNAGDTIEAYRKDMVKTDHIPEVWGKSRLSLFSYCVRLINRLAGRVDNPPLSPYRKGGENKDSRNGRLLDVGCGYGTFLNLVRDDGWEVEGVEISNQAAAYAREYLQLKVYEQPLRSLSLQPCNYNVITFFGVLDLVENPRGQINEVKRLLKPGGLIFLRVENALFHSYACRVSRWFNLSTYGISPYVFHLNNFTKSSLIALLQKAGFEYVCVRNSPLTYGDPYGGGGILSDSGVQMAKIAASIVASGVAGLTNGKCLISPSLIAWARKPIT